LPVKVAAAVDDELTISMMVFMDQVRPDVIIHIAAQPSHDRAAASPFLDLEVNALGTLHLLEAARIAQEADRHAVWLERSAA